MVYKKQKKYYEKGFYTKYFLLTAFLISVLVLFTACGIPVFERTEEQDDSQASGDCPTTDDFHMPLEREEVTETAPKTGCFAPGFTLRDLEGNDWSLKDYCGQSFLVIFWKTNCSQCVEDLKLLEELHTSEQRVEVVAINVQEEQEVVQSFVQEKGYSFQILLDTGGEVFEKYLLENVPVTFAINSRREITFIQNGPMGKENLEMLRRSALDLMELYPIIK